MTKIIASAIAAVSIAFAVSSPASADTITRECRAVHIGGYYARQCVISVQRDPVHVAEPSVKRGAGTAELVAFDPVDEARKALIVKHDPNIESLCPAPWHMTGRNGCQR